MSKEDSVDRDRQGRKVKNANKEVRRRKETEEVCKQQQMNKQILPIAADIHRNK